MLALRSTPIALQKAVMASGCSHSDQAVEGEEAIDALLVDQQTTLGQRVFGDVEAAVLSHLGLVTAYRGDKVRGRRRPTAASSSSHDAP